MKRVQLSEVICDFNFLWYTACISWNNSFNFFKSWKALEISRVVKRLGLGKRDLHRQRSQKHLTVLMLQILGKHSGLWSSLFGKKEYCHVDKKDSPWAAQARVMGINNLRNIIPVQIWKNNSN